MVTKKGLRFILEQLNASHNVDSGLSFGDKFINYLQTLTNIKLQMKLPLNIESVQQNKMNYIFDANEKSIELNAFCILQDILITVKGIDNKLLKEIVDRCYNTITQIRTNTPNS